MVHFCSSYTARSRRLELDSEALGVGEEGQAPVMSPVPTPPWELGTKLEGRDMSESGRLEADEQLPASLAVGEQVALGAKA